MAQLAKVEISDEDRERLAVTLEELAALIRSQPDRLLMYNLSWRKEHVPFFGIDQETFDNLPTSYFFDLVLGPHDITGDNK